MKKRILTILIVTVLSIIGTVMLGCGGSNSESEDNKSGAEVGEYYSDGASGEEYGLTLSEGCKATLRIDSEKSGTYTLKENGEITLELSDVTVKGTYGEGSVKIEYGGAEYTFLRKIEYTVTYESNGGSAVAPSKVINGRTIEKPANPTYANRGFDGWYKDESCTTAFAFGKDRVTGDITLYAKWAVAGTDEYEITFDGNGGEVKEKTKTTIDNRVFETEIPTRDGYTFKGWWISQYNDRERLSYRLREETKLYTETTAYAVWEKEGESIPTIDVTETGISWDRQNGTVKIKVEGPTGFNTIERTIGATTNPSIEVNFGSAPAGDYVITLEKEEKEYKVYYKNKGIDDVSKIYIEDNHVLHYGAVRNATNYYIAIKCGETGHKHTLIDNGNSVSYDFDSCEMKSDGIEFTVYADAEGYARSNGRAYTHIAKLGEVEGYKYNETDGSMSWTSVENATAYAVKINGGRITEVPSTQTRVDLRAYTGEIEVEVYAKAHGYNPSEPTTEKYTKTKLATPTGIKLEGKYLSWGEVTGKSEYRIEINDKVITTNNETINLDDYDIEWVKDRNYTFKITAVSETAENSSYISDAVNMVYGNTVTGVEYNASVVSWYHAIGAEKYRVQVNNGEVREVVGDNALEIELTAKSNKIKVSLYDGTEWGDWTVIDVSAFEITLDPNGGVNINNLYKTTGDKLDLPDATRRGYDFNGWYTALVNGSEYSGNEFTGTGDLTLYAGWTAKTYAVNLDYIVEIGTGTLSSQDIVFDSTDYVLPIPAVTDGKYLFVGWNSTRDGSGVKYTDYKGRATDKWSIAENNVTLYAYYIEAFDYMYSESTDSYTVRDGREFKSAVDLVIPRQYNGKDITSVDASAFCNNVRLRSVSLYNTVMTIDDGAFTNNTTLESFEVLDGGNPEPVYSHGSRGELIRRNPLDKAVVEIVSIPNAIEGDEYAVPEGITHIGTGVLKGYKFTKIVVPYTVNKISIDAFDSNKITEIEFLPTPSGVDAMSLELHPSAISERCTDLEELTLPARLQAFSTPVYTIFGKFTKLKAIFVGEGQNIAYSSDNTYGLLLNASGDTVLYCPIDSPFAEFIVPGAITRIDDHAFDKKAANINVSGKDLAITKLVVHANVAYIGAYAFSGCANLETVIFEAAASYSALEIGEYAFKDCTALTVIDFQEEGSLIGTVYTPVKSCGVQIIGQHAFDRCRESTIVLPSTLESIGRNAFNSNSNLTTLDLSHVNAGLEFGEYVFSSCTKLTTVEITDNVGEIGFKSVFRGSNVKHFTVSPTNPNYSVDENGILYNKDKTTLIYYPDDLTLNEGTANEGHLLIPDSVREISGSAFEGVTTITHVTISENVNIIRGSAFRKCANLESFIIEGGDQKLEIGDSNFNGCKKLKSVELPSRVTKIAENGFSYSGLTSIILHDGLEYIGEKAFFATQIESFDIPYTVQYIGSYVLDWTTITFDTTVGTAPVKSITFGNTPKGVTPVALELGDNVFSALPDITRVELPERLKYIPNNAFQNCMSLEYVKVPTTVMNYGENYGIGQYAFTNCVSLANVEFAMNKTENGEDVPDDGLHALSFGAHCFYNTAITELNLPNRIGNFGNSSYNVFEMGIDSAYNVYLWFTPRNYLQNLTYDRPLDGALQRVNVQSGGKSYSSYDGVLYTADQNTVVYCPQQRAASVADIVKEGGETIVQISKNATSFRPYAFKSCVNITKIVFEDPDAYENVPELVLDDIVTPKNESVFFGCVNLKEINFPARLTKIGNKALYREPGGVVNEVNVGEHKLSVVTFADNCKLTSIGESAFGRSLISEIVLPSGVVNVGVAPFKDYNSQSLTITISPVMDVDAVVNMRNVGIKATPTIICPEGSKFDLHENGVAYYLGEDNVRRVAFCDPDANASSEDGILTIPWDVAVIGQTAFRGIKRFTEVKFESAPDGSEEVPLYIGGGAFQQSGVETIELPARLSSMGTAVFDHDTALKNVTFAKGFKYNSIPAKTFQGCTDLGDISIPACIQSIGVSAFDMVSGAATTFALKPVVTKKGPSSITFEGNNITSIGYLAFKGCTKLETIALPESLKYLGASGSGSTRNGSVFIGCTSLKTVTFGGNNLDTIYDSTFSGCTSLESVTLPDKIEYIGFQAFYKCSGTGFTEIAIPKTVKYLGQSVFNGCTNLISVTFEQNSVLSTICANAFYNCTNLGKDTVDENGDSVSHPLIFPASLEKFGGASLTSTVLVGTNPAILTGCKNLKYVEFESSPSIEFISKETFNGLTGLVSAVLPSKLKTIGESAFKGCTKLETVTMPDTVTTISKTAFSGCSALTEIKLHNDQAQTDNGGDDQTEEQPATAHKNKLPEGVNTIGDNAFDGCKMLPDIAIQSEATLGKYVFRNCTQLSSVTLPSNLTTIPQYAFSGCENLSTIDLPTGVTAIDASAFASSGLTTIQLKGITNIGARAFSASKLQSIDLSTVTEIGANAFQNCEQLGKTKFPSRNNYIKIGNFAFDGCTNLTVDDYETKEESSGVTIPTVYILDTVGAFAFRNCDALTELAVDVSKSASSVTSKILNSAFESCDKLETVKIYGVDYIVAKAFKDCAGLSSVTLPDGLSCLGGKTGFVTVNVTGDENKTASEGAVFKNCGSLTSVSLPEGVTELYNNTFDGCTQLSSVKFYTMSSISGSAFNGCGDIQFEIIDNGEESDREIYNGGYYEGTKFLMYLGNKTEITANVFREGTTEICENAFAGKAITSLALPDSVTTIGATAFKGCTALGSVDLNKVTTIKDGAFNGCTALVSLTLPNTVSTLGVGAFEGCTGLKTVALPDTLTTLSASVFKGCTSLDSINLDKVTSIGANAFENDTALQSVTFNDAANIGASAFKKSGLTSIELKSGMKLGKSAFDGSALSGTLTIPDGMTINATAVFAACKITNVVIRSNVINTGSSASGLFYNCTELLTASIEGNVTTIGNYIFNGCGKLTTVAISAPLSSMGEGTFYNCKKLIKVGAPDKDGNVADGAVLPNGIKTITRYMFQNCSALTDIVISDNITEIKNNAFYGCFAVSSIFIPRSVAKMDTYVFNNWKTPQTIYVERAQNEITLNSGNWNSTWTGSTSMFTANVVYGYAYDGALKKIAVAENDAVTVVYVAYKNNAPDKIYYITIDGERTVPTLCVKREDGSFVVTVGERKFNVTITDTESNGSVTIVATVTSVAAEQTTNE